MLQTGGKTWTVAALLLAALMAGCGAGELQFRNDHRLSFETPDARDNVELPLTIRWSMEDFAPGDEGSFAVFVDRAPMPVGKNLRWLMRGDRTCDADPKCPTLEQLARDDVYVTTDSTLRLTQLPRPSSGRGKEQHFVNVVLLDNAGKRIGESAWYLPFTTDRRNA
jgi:hypothetical protein